MIEQQTAKKLAELFLRVSEQTAIAAHQYIQTHKRIYGLGKHAEEHVLFPKDEPRFAEMYDVISFL